jgi:hypothetical protein
MIDTAAILFSTLACLFVIFRAIQLDKTLPWYGPPKPPAAEQEAPTRKARTDAQAAAWFPDWERDTARWTGGKEPRA